jgi:hypothetical protein
MQFLQRTASTAAATISVILVGAAPALAHECVNPDKQPGAGAQVIFNEATGAMTFANPGIEKRFTSGVTTEDTFRGLIVFDFVGAGTVDGTTWIVGKYGEIPQQAQEAGADCHGVINFEAWFACMEADLPA